MGAQILFKGDFTIFFCFPFSFHRQSLMWWFFFGNRFSLMSPLCTTECNALCSLLAFMARETTRTSGVIHIASGSATGWGKDTRLSSPLPGSTCYAGPADGQTEPGNRSSGGGVHFPGLWQRSCSKAPILQAIPCSRAKCLKTICLAPKHWAIGYLH